MTQLAGFLAVSLLVICTPGQDTALTIRNTLVGGRRSGVFTAFGVASGNATWAVATSAGLAALIVASEPAFVALRLVGAAYLVFLGAQALWGALRPGPARERAPARPRRRAAPGTSYRQGLTSNLANAKVAAFFTSLLPQFAPAGGDAFAALLVLGLVFSTLTLAWLVLYALAVAKAGNLLRRRKIRRVLDIVTGTALVAFGVRLAAERH